MHPKWLIVDDDDSFLESLRSMFASYSEQIKTINHLEILISTNVTEALLVVQHQSPTLVITDIRMPQVDGYQFLKLLQRQHPDVPKVVLSGYIDPTTRGRCAQAGAEIVLSKPADPVEALEIFMALKEADKSCSVPQTTLVAHAVSKKPASKDNKFIQVAADEEKAAANSHQSRVLDSTTPAKVKSSQLTGAEKVDAVAQTPVAASRAKQGLTGVIPGINVMELVQMLSHSGHSSRLEIKWAAGKGVIYLFKGAVIHAACPGLIGLEALYTMLCADDGKFEIHEFQEPVVRSINLSTTELLMEAARRMDMASHEEMVETAPIATFKLEHTAANKAVKEQEQQMVPVPKHKVLQQTHDEPRADEKQAWRKMTANLTARRQVTIIEEQIDFKADLSEEFRSAFSQQTAEENESEPISPLEAAGVPCEGLLELVVSTPDGKASFIHQSAKPELRIDLLEFFSIKKRQIDQQIALGKLLHVRLTGVTEEYMIALTEEASMFARFNRPEYPTDKLLEFLSPASCLIAKN